MTIKERIILFLYNRVSLIKKCRINKLNNFLEPIGLKELLESVEYGENENVIRMLASNTGEEYKQAYNVFRKTVEENFSPSDLKNFYYNSEWVIVHKIKFNPFTRNIGTYDCIKNKLRFKDNSIYHELFHLASTNYDYKYICCGFSIDTYHSTIGMGINEGYTDLLTQRYFNEEIDDYYFYESKFAGNLEKIIGQKKMEKLYLDGNFFEFIKELKKYYEVEEIEKFLINVDVISLYNCTYLSEDETRKINLLIEDCICFLIKGFCKKLKQMPYSMEMKKKYIAEYFEDLNFFYGNYEENHKFNMDRINKVIENYLSKDARIEKSSLNKKIIKKMEV